MRDPKRIRKFCNELASIWERECPDWRFLQLIANVMGGNLPFYMEEEETMRRIKDYFQIED